MKIIERAVGLTLLLSSIALAGGSGLSGIDNEVSGSIETISSIFLKVIYAVAIIVGVTSIYTGAKTAFFKDASDRGGAEANTEKGVKIIIFGIICILLPVIINVIYNWTSSGSGFTSIKMK